MFGAEVRHLKNRHVLTTRYAVFLLLQVRLCRKKSEPNSKIMAMKKLKKDEMMNRNQVCNHMCFDEKFVCPHEHT